MRPLLAEALGTFWIVLIAAGLVSAGAGSGDLAGDILPAAGQGAPGIGVGVAAGLAYLGAALAFGRISMGHFHPALTLGLRGAGGFGGSLTFTLLAQIFGASCALLFVGPPPVDAAAAPFAAMLLLVPLIAVPVLMHVSGMRVVPATAVYCNAAALAVAVALAPGGLAAVNASHATAAWLTGDGAPLGLWRIWLATLAAVGLATWLDAVLRTSEDPGKADTGDPADDIAAEGPAGATGAEAGAARSNPSTASAEARAGATAEVEFDRHGIDRQGIDRQGRGRDASRGGAALPPGLVTALIDAGWTPPDKNTRKSPDKGPNKNKGRAPQNAPLAKVRRKPVPRTRR